MGPFGWKPPFPCCTNSETSSFKMTLSLVRAGSNWLAGPRCAKAACVALLGFCYQIDCLGNFVRERRLQMERKPRGSSPSQVILTGASLWSAFLVVEGS